MATKKVHPTKQLENAKRAAARARAELKAINRLIEKGWKPKE